MRNQYKILAEKYELVLEASMEQPAQQGREIKGVFVPAEIENWINTMIKTPIYNYKGINPHSVKKYPIVGYKDLKADQDFEPAELKLIVNKIYNQWKNSSFEVIQPELTSRGLIGRALNSAIKIAKLTPSQLETRRLRKKTNRIKNNLKTIEDYNANPTQVPSNVLKVLAFDAVTRARARARAENLPFFYEVDIDRPDYIIIKERNEAVEYVMSIWPKDNTCPATGLRLRRIPGAKTDNSPSLDKFIPEKGYVKGNVAIISELANRVKNTGNLDQVYKVYEYTLEGKNVLKKIENHANGFDGELDNPVTMYIRNGIKVPVRRIRTGSVSKHAKEINVPFNINVEYLRSIFPIKSAMVCPVLGIPLIWTPGSITNNTPALDRINLKEGYVRGNLVYISTLANTMKSDATPEQILGVYNWMKAYHA